MSLTIENRPESGVVLVKHVGRGENTVLVPFLSPSEKKLIEEEGDTYFTVVPLTEPDSTLLPIPLEGAREEIPVDEVIGHGFPAYMVNSKPVGEGAQINGVQIEVENTVEVNGIVFTTS